MSVFEKKKEETCCCCGNRAEQAKAGGTGVKALGSVYESSSEKKVVVDYLYLDLQTCNRCIGTDGVLDAVMLTLTPALELAGYSVEYRKAEMKTAKLAEQYQFLSSPTIRVNGRDICQNVQENRCGCCGEISGTQVDCRIFEYNGETYEVPPKEMLAEAILQVVFGQNESDYCCGEYVMPENLKQFFKGKSKSACSCKSGCC